MTLKLELKHRWNNVQIVIEKEAIRYAISNMLRLEIIVLAGRTSGSPGIKGVKHDMDERVIIAEIVKESKRENLIR